jgi:hypothetical protein
MRLYRQFYQVLNKRILLETDSLPFLSIFNRDFDFFKSPTQNSDRNFKVLVKLEGTAEDSYLSFNEKVFPLTGHPDKKMFAYQLILREIFNRENDFLVLHAGVVAREGRATIISGVPGVGKTTLVMALLDSGYSFLSDDICPIHWKTGRVHPFPRSLHVIDPPFFFDKANATDPGRKRKIPVKWRELRSAVFREPCLTGGMIHLDPGPPKNYVDLEIEMKNDPRPFIRKLRALKGLELKIRDEGFIVLQVRYPQNQGLASVIKEIIEDNREDIWRSRAVINASPEFNKNPVMKRLSAHQAAFLLLEGAKQRFETPAEGDGSLLSPGRFLFRLSSLLDRIPCHQISVGFLEKMKDLVVNLKGADH